MSEFLKKLARSLGLSPVWWQWRWLNFKKRWKGAFSSDRNVARHLRSRSQKCRCGALAGPGDRVCAVCGARLPSTAAAFLARSSALILPGALPATAILTAIIVVAFVVQAVVSGGTALFSPRAEILIRMGALYTGLVSAGEWWRLLTSVFVHIGIIHLAFNTFALVSVSRLLEAEIGSSRYLALFLLAGLGGATASYALRPAVLMAGASGAIFGLIGFSISYFRRQGGARAGAIRTFMIRWAVYAFVFGFLVRADNIAHAGGFAAGFLLGAIMEIREDERQRRDPVWNGMAGVLAVVLAICFVLLARSPH